MPLLRIATANLLHGMSLTYGEARASDLAAAATVLDADVVGLQEVDRHQDRSDGVDQTAEVAAAMAAVAWRFVPAVLGTPGPVRTWRAAPDGTAAGSGLGPDDAAVTTMAGPSYGVGLASRWPVRRWAVRRFAPSRFSLPLVVPGQPRPRVMVIPDEPRLGLAAVMDGPTGPLTVVTAHLSFVPGTNVRQLRALAQWALEFPSPRFLIGDFNLPGALPARLTRWDQLARIVTYPAPAPRVQLDHVLGHGVTSADVRGVTAPRLVISDHRALVVEVELPGRA